MGNSKDSTYENSILGSIVIIHGLVFCQKFKHKNQVDHACLTGRPCIIIYTDDEYDYFLPLSSSATNLPNYNKLKNKCFELSKKSFLYSKNVKPTGVVNMGEYFRKKISGYSVIGKLTKESYTALVKEFSAYHKSTPQKMAKKATKK